MAKVTIADVAAYANVSRATVSRVVNGNTTVDEALRLRVEEAIRVLGYRPNRIARRLRKDSHDVIGLIVSDIQNPHFVSVIKGVEEAAYTNGLNLLLCNSDEDPQRLAKYLDVMRAESVSGLIVVPTNDEDAVALAALRENNIPIVILDRIIAGFDADVVRSNNEESARQLVQHMIDQGHRRIAIVYPNVQTGTERYAGYLAALEHNGLVPDPALAKVEGHRIENSYCLTKELLGENPLPDAIFTATNLMTIGALRALRELNIRIPDDIALAGFDDLPWADEFATPVTVISQPTYQIGQTAVEVLMRRLEKPHAPYVIHDLDTTLIVRASCGTPAASQPNGEHH